jgi:hypothetical protein
MQRQIARQPSGQGFGRHTMATFRIGDKVRLKVGRHHPRYKVGDSGTVTAVMPKSRMSGQELYQVRVEGHKDAVLPVFYADELELVVD